MIIPFEFQGVSMYPVEEAMLIPTEGILGDTLGLNGLLFFVNFFFWLMWVNILLGFTNLIQWCRLMEGICSKIGLKAASIG